MNPSARNHPRVTALARLTRPAHGRRLLALLCWWVIAALSTAATIPGVSFEQRIGAQLPLATELRDEAGRAVRLGDLFGGRPALLLFGYSRCPELCSVVANGTVQTLRELRATAGRDFAVLYVSIDPRDTPRDLAGLKRRDVGRYGRTGAGRGWHYLGGPERSVRALANAAGFHYTYDERQKLYAHPSGFIVLTPDGRISQYFLGVDFNPKEIASAVERAADGKTGRSVFNLLLLCARGAAITGKYGRLIWITVEVSAALTVLALFGGIGWMLWQERRANRAAVGPAGSAPAGWPAKPRPPAPTALPGIGGLGLAFAFRDWLPDRASTIAPQVDHVFWTAVAFTVVLVIGLVAANLYFLIRYRRGSNAPRPPLTINHNYIEATWITATTIGFLGFFFWGAHLYLTEERPPADALRIDVTARQWMWDIRHENGRREFNELHVPRGEDVQLVMTSEDVIHSFFVPAFRVKQDVVPGKQVSLWFKATKTGTFHLFCAEYCGTVHSGMVGDVVVQSPQQYAVWLAQGNSIENLAMRGRRLFTRYNCSGCHDQPAAVHAPVLTHLYGTLVPLSDGRKVRANDAYIRDSILQPEKDIVAGYQPLMPTFQNVIPESDVLDLIAYIRSLPGRGEVERDTSVAVPLDANAAAPAANGSQHR